MKPSRPTAREDQLDLLQAYITSKPSTTLDHIILRGAPSTGKSYTLKYHLAKLKTRVTFISCDQCLSVKVLMNRLIDGIKVDSGLELDPAYDVAASSSFQGFIKSLKDFVKEWDYEDLHYLVLDRVDQIIEDHEVIYEYFARFQEILGCGQFRIVWVTNEDPLRLTGIKKMEIFFDRYTRDEIVKVLQSNNTMLSICKFPKGYQVSAKQRETFWKNYTELVTDLYLPYSTNLDTLLRILKKLWPKIIEPIINGSTPINEFFQIYRHNFPLLTSDYALQPSHTIYNSITQNMESNNNTTNSNSSTEELKKETPLSNLSKYSQYLIVSAYICSHTPAKADYVLFSKLQSYNKRNPTKLRASYDTHDHSLHEPSLYTLERWLAVTQVLYSMHFPDKFISDVDLYTQIEDLETLKFVVKSDKGSLGLSGFGKWRVNLSIVVVKGVSEGLGVNLEQYLV